MPKHIPIFLLFLSSIAFAQIPQTITFQGYLSDSNGIPVSGMRLLTFELFEQPSGGPRIWNEDIDSVSVQAGLFSVNLGMKNEFSNQGVTFEKPYWLQVTANPGGIVGTRIRLNATPYSLNSRAVSGTSNVFPSEGNVGIGVITPAEALEINGNISLVTGGIKFSDGSIQISASDSGATVWSRSMNDVFYNAGNVGLGTTDPREQLELTGNLLLGESTDTTGIIYLKDSTLTFSYLGNFFTGYGAGNLGLSTARDNVGVGSSTLRSISSGTHNSAVGSNALKNNTAGFRNTALGSRALFRNAVGDSNTAVGAFTLSSNMGDQNTGNSNSAFGVASLTSNISGNSNTAIGVQTLVLNTSGTSNSSLGRSSLQSNTSGNHNVAIGYKTLDNNVTGSFNSALGANANIAQSNLSNATAIGANAVVDSSNKIRLGDDAVQVVETNGLFSSLAGGFKLPDGFIISSRNELSPWGNLNNNIFFSNGSVGIGTSTPQEQLELTDNLRLPIGTSTNGIIFAGNTPFIHHDLANGNFFSGDSAGNTLHTGIMNSGVGSNALQSLTTGSDNTALGAKSSKNIGGAGQNTSVGVNSLQKNITGDFNTAIGYKALYNATGLGNTAIGRAALDTIGSGQLNTAIGFNADAASPDLVNATAIGANAIVDSSNTIQLGDGNILRINSKVDLTIVSDSTKKSIFKRTNGEYVLSKLRSFRLGSWSYLGQNSIRHYGPFAQEFYSAFGDDGIGKVGSDTTLTGSDVTGINMIAIQALEERTALQQQQIDSLNAANNRLSEQLAHEKSQVYILLSRVAELSEQFSEVKNTISILLKEKDSDKINVEVASIRSEQ